MENRLPGIQRGSAHSWEAACDSPESKSHDHLRGKVFESTFGAIWAIPSSLHHFVWEKVWDREKWKNHVQWSSIKFDVCLIHSTGPTSLRVEISTNVKRKCDRYVQMFHRSRKASLQWQWHVWAVCAVSKTSDVCSDFNSEMHPLFWHFSWVAQSFHHFWPGKANDKTSVRLISKVWEGKPGKYHAKPPRICLDVPQTTPMPPAPSQSLEARNGPGTDSTGWAWSFVVAQLLLFLCFCCFSLIIWIISSTSSHLSYWLWINSELHAVPGIAINTEVSENLLHGGRGPGPTC